MKYIFILLLFSACTRQVIITRAQPHIITGIDTIRHDLRLHIAPAGIPSSIIKNKFRIGDTVQVLMDRKVRL